jgi:hypothetical protein
MSVSRLPAYSRRSRLELVDRCLVPRRGAALATGTCRGSAVWVAAGPYPYNRELPPKTHAGVGLGTNRSDFRFGQGRVLPFRYRPCAPSEHSIPWRRRRLPISSTGKCSPALLIWSRSTMPRPASACRGSKARASRPRYRRQPRGYDLAWEWTTASGDWVKNRTYGQQLNARFLSGAPSGTRTIGRRAWQLPTLNRPWCPCRRIVGSSGERSFTQRDSTIHANWSSSAFASFKSGVPKPSVNQA